MGPLGLAIAGCTDMGQVMPGHYLAAPVMARRWVQVSPSVRCTAKPRWWYASLGNVVFLEWSGGAIQEQLQSQWNHLTNFTVEFTRACPRTGFFQSSTELGLNFLLRAELVRSEQLLRAPPNSLHATPRAILNLRTLYLKLKR